MKIKTCIFLACWFLPSAAAALLVDDFKDGDQVNALGGIWHQYSDDLSSNDFRTNDKPGFGSSPYCAHVRWALKTGPGVPHSYAGIMTFLNPFYQAVDLSGYKGVRFYAKGKGMFRISVMTSATKDFTSTSSQYGRIFPLSGEWHLYEADCTDFTQSWGEPKPWVPEQSYSINFEAHAQVDTEMWLANIELFSVKTDSVLEQQTALALRAHEIALTASQAAGQALAKIRQAVQKNGPEAGDQAKDLAAQIQSCAETSALASEVVRNAVAETNSSTISALASDTARAAALAAASWEQAGRLVQGLPAHSSGRPSGAPAGKPAPLPLLPEKYDNRIVVGLETKIITDFGSIRDMEPILQNLALYLEQAAGMKLEWRLLSPAELLLALHQGELDGVAAYEANLDRFLGNGRLEPVLTVRGNNGTEQPCCLLVRAGSPIRTLAQAQGRRLGYSNGLIPDRLNLLFFRGQEADSGRYFGSLEKQKNARDSLLALQMETVDMVAEYAYILDIARTMPEMHLRVIAESAPKPNAPLLLRTSRFPGKNQALRKLTNALLHLHQDPGRSWLQAFQVQQAVAADEAPRAGPGHLFLPGVFSLEGGCPRRPKDGLNIFSGRGGIPAAEGSHSSPAKAGVSCVRDEKR